MYMQKFPAVSADVLCFLLQSYDGRMHMQKVHQQVQRKQCAFRQHLEDVSPVDIKEPNMTTL